jgi:hypothetical protein
MQQATPTPEPIYGHNPAMCRQALPVLTLDGHAVHTLEVDGLELLLLLLLTLKQKHDLHQGELACTAQHSTKPVNTGPSASCAQTCNAPANIHTQFRTELLLLLLLLQEALQSNASSNALIELPPAM